MSRRESSDSDDDMSFGLFDNPEESNCKPMIQNFKAAPSPAVPLSLESSQSYGEPPSLPSKVVPHSLGGLGESYRRLHAQSYGSENSLGGRLGQGLNPAGMYIKLILHGEY